MNRAMLLDDCELQIMAAAAQPHLRTQYPDDKERGIFEDFFAGRSFGGTRILELGPGQGDFARIVTAAGASVVIFDHDPAVVALARKRGHEANLADVMTYDWGSQQGAFDGLYARSSIAPHWFSDPAPLATFINRICCVLKPAGWGWVLPWNRFGKSDPRPQVDRLLDAQSEAFERHGFTT